MAGTSPAMTARVSWPALLAFLAFLAFLHHRRDFALHRAAPPAHPVFHHFFDPLGAAAVARDQGVQVMRVDSSSRPAGDRGHGRCAPCTSLVSSVPEELAYA